LVAHDAITLSFLTAPVVASTFSIPKNFWRAAIIAGSAALATDAPSISASGSRAAANCCRFMSPPRRAFRLAAFGLVGSA
jgi:hypothetical protein